MPLDLFLAAKLGKIINKLWSIPCDLDVPFQFLQSNNLTHWRWYFNLLPRTEVYTLKTLENNLHNRNKHGNILLSKKNQSQYLSSFKTNVVFWALHMYMTDTFILKNQGFIDPFPPQMPWKHAFVFFCLFRSKRFWYVQSH